MRAARASTSRRARRPRASPLATTWRSTSASSSTTHPAASACSAVFCDAPFALEPLRRALADRARPARARRLRARRASRCERACAMKARAAAGLAVALCGASGGSARARRALRGGDRQQRGHGDESPLRYAESDAARVYDVLHELGGFEPFNMVLLRDETRDTVRSTLIALNDRIRDAHVRPGHAGGAVRLLLRARRRRGASPRQHALRASPSSRSWCAARPRSFRLARARRLPLRRAHAHQGRARRSRRSPCRDERLPATDSPS